MNIKIIGTKCSNGMKLKKIVSRAIENMESSFEVEYLDDEKSIHRHNIKNVPGLVINEQVVSEGKVLTVREVTRYINAFIEA